MSSGATPSCPASLRSILRPAIFCCNSSSDSLCSALSVFRQMLISLSFAARIVSPRPLPEPRPLSSVLLCFLLTRRLFFLVIAAPTSRMSAAVAAATFELLPCPCSSYRFARSLTLSPLCIFSWFAPNSFILSVRRPASNPRPATPWPHRLRSFSPLPCSQLTRFYSFHLVLFRRTSP